MKVKIRKRKLEDFEELAHATAVVWNTTYKGIIDQEFLTGLFEKEKQSAEKLKNNINKQPNYYVLTFEDKIIGWIYYTLNSDKYENAAEIHALYILKEYQGNGYGKLLYNYAVENIRKNSINNLIIGCLEGNPSNDFYKHLGGKQIKTNLFKEKYLENIYLFKL